MKLGIVLGLIVLGVPMAFADLEGTVFSDVNGNGVQDSGESGIPDTVVLYVDMSDFDNTDTTTTSDSGQYSFNVPAGNYLVQVEGTTLYEYLTVPDNETITHDFASESIDSCIIGYSIVGNECVMNTNDDNNSTILDMINSIIQRLTALESSMTPVDCPTGQVPVDGTCMDVICPIGYELDGNRCDRIRCDTGYSLNYTTNMCEFDGCPHNYTLDGSECIFDTTSYHLRTDKAEYTSGDTILVSGKVKTPDIHRTVGGTVIEHDEEIEYRLWHQLPNHLISTYSNTIAYLDCHNPGYEYDGESGTYMTLDDAWYEINPDTGYHSSPCTITFNESTGEFSFEIPVDESWPQNDYNLKFTYSGDSNHVDFRNFVNYDGRITIS